ncbi:DUF397 domain-containing protein [Actinophytocola sediminis]
MNGDGPHHDDAWRKARRSNENDSCVEVHPTRAYLRDSKNLTGPTLSVDVGTLVTAIRNDVGLSGPPRRR